MSGYSEEVVAAELLPRAQDLLSKPFDARTLLERVERVRGSARPAFSNDILNGALSA